MIHVLLSRPHRCLDHKQEVCRSTLGPKVVYPSADGSKLFPLARPKLRSAKPLVIKSLGMRFRRVLQHLGL